MLLSFMETLTLVLIIAAFLVAGVAFAVRKAPVRLWVLVLTFSICGIGAVILDPELSSDNNSFLLSLVPLAVIFIYSAYSYSIRE